MRLDWTHKAFSQLDAAEFHEVLCARQAVFILEQRLICEEVDKYDLTSIHLIGRDTESEEIHAYARLHAPQSKYPEASFGRVLVSQSVRNTGMGKQLVQRCIDHCQSLYSTNTIRISAQAELTGFYQPFGFEVQGEPYSDAGIPHIDMLRAP